MTTSQPEVVAGRDEASEEQKFRRLYRPTYGLAVATAIALWFLAIRTPLWLDETSSFWQISAGFRGILARRGGLPPVYPYMLWFTSKLIGTSEIALRVPSVLAMLAAVYMLYRAACEIFERDAAMVAVIVFCLHPIVIFTAIDARPYALGALAINSALYLLVRLRRSDSDWLAAGFGLAAAAILYFHYLFGAILPALAVCFFAFNDRERKTVWRQFAIALAVFCVALLPLIPDFLLTFHARHMYVFDKSQPDPEDIGWTLVPGWVLVAILGMTAGVALVTKHLRLRGGVKSWRLLLCVLTAFVPLLTLYGVSAVTPLHMFMARYRLVAVPGVALGWGLFANRIDSRLIRVLFAVAMVAGTAYVYISSPESRQHGYTWKYALEFAGKNAAPDHASILMCSDFPSSDYVDMPVGEEIKDSSLFTPLRYYRVAGRVVGMPRALNDEAKTIGGSFLAHAAAGHERFLILAYAPSYPTVRWMEEKAAGSYTARKLGTFDGVEVVEFAPARP